MNDADGAVDWDLAASVGRRVAARHPRTADHLGPTDRSLVPLVELAEELVIDATGLRPPGPATVRVISREEWIDANLAAFRRMLAPAIARWTARTGAAAGSGGAHELGRSLTARVTATQMGALLGWMSGRVLGQYDVLMAAGDDGDATDAESTSAGSTGDVVYLVGPNMAQLEQRYAFGTEQFRLWVTLHELTHRAQFRGVPWMQAHYRGLVDEALTIADPDPQRVLGALRTALTDRATTRAALRDGGAVALFASPEQRAVLQRVAGLMSLLEGHGDVTMDRAGIGHVPDAARFGHVLRARRTQASATTRLVQKLLGLEAKLDQYRAGEEFIRVVEGAAGVGIVDRCWESPENLPSLTEIRDPQLWLRRVGVLAAHG